MVAVGTVIRDCVAVLLSLIVLFALRPRLKAMDLAKSSRLAAHIRQISVAVALFWAVAWLGIAFVRLRYPYELEWIGGAMLDHTMRIVHGKPLYVAPSGGWFPYEYPPLYFQLSASMMGLLDDYSFIPMRLISIIATIGTALFAAIWTREVIVSNQPGASLDTRKRASTWGVLAAGMFLAAYRFTGAWYDAERLDMLFICLSMAAGYLLHRACRTEPDPDKRVILAEAPVLAILSGLLFACAFFTKQQAVLFVIAGIAAMCWLRRYSLAGVFFASWLVPCIAGITSLDRETKGWFTYYCFKVPLGNGIKPHLAAQFLFLDLPLFAPAIALTIVAFAAISERKAQAPGVSVANREASTSIAVFAAMAAAALFGSLLSRAHWGGAENVLIPAYLFIAMSASIASGYWALKFEKESAAWTLLLVLAQLVVVAYRPDLQIPKPANYAAGTSYVQLLNRLQRRGNVLSMDHGGVTLIPHFQVMAMLDVIGKEKKTPQTFLDALQRHRYSCIVVDTKPKAEGLMAQILAEYPNVERIGIKKSWVVTGFPTPAADRDVYVLRP